MASQTDVTIKIGVNTADVTKGVQSATTEVKKIDAAAGKAETSLKGSAKAGGQAFATFAGGLAALGVAAAIGAIGDAARKTFAAFTTEGVAAAQKQEKAWSAAVQAMKLTGENSVEAQKDLAAWASILQDLTGAGDEFSLELFSLAKAFGLTNKEAKDVVTVSHDVAAAMGVDARTAVTQLAGTFNGVTGRLSKLNPQITGLSKESLAAGEAVALLGTQLAGTAAAKLDTYSGAIDALKGRFGDLQEQFGNVVIQSPEVQMAIKDISDWLKQMTTDMEATSKASIGETIGDIVKAAQSSIEVLRYLAEELGHVYDAAAYIAQGGVFGDLARRLTESTVVVEDATDAWEKFRHSQNFIGPLTQEDALNKVLIAEAKELDKIDKLEEGRTQEIADQETAAKKRGAVEARLAIEKKKAAEEFAKQGAEDEQAHIELISANRDKDEAGYQAYIDTQRKETGKLIAEEDKDRTKLLADQTKKYQEQWIAVGGCVEGFLTGGLENVTQKAVSSLTETFLPGFGGAAGQVFQLMTTSTEEFANFLNQLVSVEFLDNFLKNIDVIIEKLPDIVQKLLTAIIEKMPQITGRLLELFLDVDFQSKLVLSVVKGFTQGFAKALADFPRQIAEAIKKGVQSVGNVGGDLLSSIGDFLGFAGGGIVPGNSRVSGDSPANDTVMAMLSPGEAVIPRSKMAQPGVRAVVGQLLETRIPAFAAGGTVASQPTVRATSSLEAKIDSLTAALLSSHGDVVVQVDGREIARGIRRQVAGGFAL